MEEGVSVWACQPCLLQTSVLRLRFHVHICDVEHQSYLEVNELCVPWLPKRLQPVLENVLHTVRNNEALV